MTARERLNQQMRRSGTAIYAGVGLFLFGMALALLLDDESIYAVCLPGFAIGFIATFVQLATLRCPHCLGNIARTLTDGGCLSVHQQVRYCPLCGHGLDEELPEHPATHC